MTAELSNNSSDGLDFRRLLILLRRYWLIFILVSGGTFAFTAFRTFRLQTIYEASGELLLNKSNDTSRLTGVAQGVGQLDSISDPLNTQSQVIRSEPIIGNAIQTLSLKDATGEFISRGTVLVNLNVQPVRGTDLIRVAYRSSNAQEAAALVNEIMNSYIKSDINANRSKTRAARVFINEQIPKIEQELEEAESNLQKFREKNQIVNLNKESESSVEAVASLDTQVTEINAQIASANSELNDLSNEVSIAPDQAVTLSKISQSKSVQQVLLELQKVEEQLTSQKALYKDSHPLIKQQERRFNALNALLKERIQSTLGEKLPDKILTQLESSLPTVDGRLQLGELEQSLLSQLVAVEIKRNSLNQRKQELTEAMERYRQRAKEFSQLERIQRQLERKLTVSRITYEGLLTKLQEVQLAENQEIGNVRILSQAELPVVPILPNIRRNLLLGGVVGILLASALIWFIQSLDNILRSSEEVMEAYRFPVLGVLPRLPKYAKDGHGKKNRSAKTTESTAVAKSRKSRSPEAGAPICVYARDYPRSSTSEAFRILQTNIRFLRSNLPIKSIVITSAIPNEGKSTLSANLAAVMAQSGKRVLLVDADLRRSDQFHLWDVPRYPGLSEVMIGATPWQDALELVMPNLWLLPSGTNPPNPVALFDSKRIAQLLEEWHSKYDYIIIDSPAILTVADALLLGKDADGIVIVARPGILQRGAAQRAKELLMQSGINVLGQAINAITLQGTDHYYYYHHYYTTDMQENNNAETGV